MRKWIALALALVMTAAMTACGSTSVPSGSEGASESVGLEDGSGSASVLAETDPADSSMPEEGEGSLPADASQSAQAPEEEEPRKSMTFGFSRPAEATASQIAVEEELRTILESNGDTLVTSEPAADSEAQIQQMEGLLEQGIDALFLCPVDPEAISAGMTACQEANVPVFGFGDWGESAGGVVSRTVADEYDAGYVCGEDLAEKCPDGGKIVVLEQSDLPSVTERVTGFLEATEELGVPFELVAQLDAQGQEELAAAHTQDALTAHPDVAAIFAGNDTMVLGALSAAEEAGAQCMIYGVDIAPVVEERLGSSLLEGISGQSPAVIAEALSGNAYQYLDGEDVAATAQIPTFLMTVENKDVYVTDSGQ